MRCPLISHKLPDAKCAEPMYSTTNFVGLSLEMSAGEPHASTDAARITRIPSGMGIHTSSLFPLDTSYCMAPRLADC